jgi:streptomycin 6-kinase
MPGDLAVLAPWLARWDLTLDGDPFRTGYANSLLAPVRRAGEPAMLKLSRHVEDLRAADLMVWWAGEGAARVLARDGEALLLERLQGPRSLAGMARDGRDDDASAILCGVADRLHAPRAKPAPSDLAPLSTWLRALAPAAGARGGILAASQAMAGRLLTANEEPCVLHGDLHHANVLDAGARGWLAIDPKGICGPRAYDYANILCNPDAETALAPGRLARQVTVVAEAARLPRERVLQWLLVHAGVSAAWSLQDGFDPSAALAIAEIAAGL